MFKPLFLLAAGLFCSQLSMAQSSTNASGGNAGNSTGSVAYTVGEVFITNISTATGSIESGVQHAYEITTTNGITHTGLDINLTAYPNPTADVLTLQVNPYNKESYSYQLYDLLGKLLHSGPITAQETAIDMTALPAAVYLVSVINPAHQTIQSFQIIKK